MTLRDFNVYNRFKTMPYQWIGQGYGYKTEWNPKHPDDIIYIPEYGYEGNKVERENAYSYTDFVKLCDGNIHLAENLFNSLDWQFPESLLDEWDDEYL